MKDKVLYGQLVKRMKEFNDTYFDTPPQNMFESIIPKGHEALPVLLDTLTHENADQAGRTDALIAIGRIYREHGTTAQSLALVVDYAKSLSQTGMTGERQAALFAIGNSRSKSLMESFAPLLESDQSEAVIIACYVMGYAQWTDSYERIATIAANAHRRLQVVSPPLLH